MKVVECCDNRFEIIGKAKEQLLKCTNIETQPREMELLDNILFRCWQMGWLDNSKLISWCEEQKNTTHSRIVRDAWEEVIEKLKEKEKC